MTLASDGSATLAYRVTIDGCPSSVVGLPTMVAAGSSTLFARINGLDMRGQKFTANCDPLACKVTVGGLTIKFVDIDGTWSAIFNKSPPNTTWLAADCDDNDTTITVDSTSGFASAGNIWIDSECIAYSGVTGTTFTGCTRGALSDDADSATYHYISDGARLRYPEVTDWPVLWEGRRVRVYRYQETDSLTGAGTQVYLGKVSTSPQFDGVSWSIGVDSIVSILDQTIGADLDEPTYPRGVTYPPEHPITLVIKESTSTQDTGNYEEPYARAVMPEAGDTVTHWETNQEFVDAFNVKIAAAQLAAGQINDTLVAVNDGDQVGWHLEYIADGADPRLLVVEGRTGSLLLASPVESTFGSASNGPQNQFGRAEASVGAGGRYYYWPSPNEYTASGITPHFTAPTGVPGAGTVPRGVVDANNEAPRIYLGSAAPVSSLVNLILIEWADGIADSYMLGDYDSAERLIELSGLDFVLGYGTTTPVRQWTSASMPKIRLGLSLSESGGLPLGSLGFMRTITDNQQQFSTLGIVPMLRTGDWDAGAWLTNAIAGQPQFVTRRWYSTMAPVSIGDIVREELKLSQCFLAIDSTGRIVPKRLRLPAGSELGSATPIDQDTLLTDKILVSHEVSGLGQVNEVVLRTGYEPADDEFLGRTIKVRDVAAYGQSPSVRSVVIAPKSQFLGDPISNDDAVRLSSGIFGAFAGAYAIDTLDAAMHDDVQLGDALVFDNPHLPSSDGTIGATGIVGLTLGREAEAYGPRTRFTLLTTIQKVAGYAPAAFITLPDIPGNGTADLWALLLDTDYFPAGATDVSDWYAVGDRVRVVQFNASTAAVVAGIVTVTNAFGVTVQFDGTWTPSADTWFLTMADSDDSALAATQRRFCSIAGSAGIVDYASNDAPAYRFGA